MSKKYNNPGEVRRAVNYRCGHCGAVFTTPQGINGHLHMRHCIPTALIEYLVDWGTTKAVAGPNKSRPAASR